MLVCGDEANFLNAILIAHSMKEIVDSSSEWLLERVI